METTTTQTPPDRILTDAEVIEHHRARRVRIALRVLAWLGVFGVAVLVVWPVYQHLRSTFWLQAIGSHIEWTIDKETWYRGGVTSASFSDARTALRDADLAALKGFRNLEALDLAECDSITDQGLSALRPLSGLKNLDLSRNRLLVAPEDVQPRLTDAALVHVGKLSNLSQLTLTGNHVTDAGMARLTGLARLEYLDLRETRVTDAGLEPLKRLKHLKTLRAAKTRITPEGAMALRAVLPEVEVVIVSEPEAEFVPDGR